MPFSFKSLEIPDIIRIEPKVFPDERGFFQELYKTSDFIQAGLPGNYNQDNFSFSKKDVLRGLHYQKDPKAQGKVVSVMKGNILDVAVDIRKNSVYYLQWVAEELSDKNHVLLYIPPGFAHGFIALSEEVHLLYKCTHEYDAQADAGIRWDDPDIAINWPVKHPMVSEKDRQLPFIKEAVVF
jgi:dTDP-4-dehydrorhamnose 3,5-epimerase